MLVIGTPLAGAQFGCYAVRVRTRQETAVSRTLRQKGYEILLPTYIHRRRYSDRIKEVRCALFPGYVFVRMDTEELLPIASTGGVICVVRSGNSLHPLRPEEAEALESLCKLTAGCEPCATLGAGERVRIESGPLQGLYGTLVRAGDRDRLVISIDSISSSVSVDLLNTVIKTVD